MFDGRMDFGKGLEFTLMAMAGLAFWKVIDILFWVSENVNLSISIK